MKKEKMVKFTMFIEEGVLKRVETMGYKHKRVKGAMIRVLIDEALEMRERKITS